MRVHRNTLVDPLFARSIRLSRFIHRAGCCEGGHSENARRSSAKRRCQPKLERLVRVLFGSHPRERGIQTVRSISLSGAERSGIHGDENETREGDERGTTDATTNDVGNCCCYCRVYPYDSAANQRIRSSGSLDGCPPVRPKRKPSVSVGFPATVREESASAALDESPAFIRDARRIPSGRRFLYRSSLSFSFSLSRPPWRCSNPNYVDAWRHIPLTRLRCPVVLATVFRFNDI